MKSFHSLKVKSIKISICFSAVETRDLLGLKILRFHIDKSCSHLKGNCIPIYFDGNL